VKNDISSNETLNFGKIYNIDGNGNAMLILYIGFILKCVISC